MFLIVLFKIVSLLFLYWLGNNFIFGIFKKWVINLFLGLLYSFKGELSCWIFEVDIYIIMLLIDIVFFWLWVIKIVVMLRFFWIWWIYCFVEICNLVLRLESGLFINKIFGFLIIVWVIVICCCWLFESFVGFFCKIGNILIFLVIFIILLKIVFLIEIMFFESLYILFFCVFDKLVFLCLLLFFIIVLRLYLV